VAVRWAPGAPVVVTWRLGEVALLKRHGVVGRIATNLINRRDGLGFNIHRCTSVTKNMNTSQNRDKLNKSS
jgi:hypothetical protein